MTTTTRADHAELFAAVPQQADDDEARADLRLLDDDYVDPLACAVAGHRWTYPTLYDDRGQNRP